MEYKYIKDPRKFHNRYLRSIVGRKIHPDSDLYMMDVSTKIEFMSPTKFLGLELPIGGRDYESHFYPAEIERVNDVKEKLKNGIPIDPLFLMINIRNNRIIHGDGTHRAMAAQDLNIKRVPVYIIYVEITKDNKGHHYITDIGEDLSWLTKEEDSTYGVDIRDKKLSNRYVPDQIIFTKNSNNLSPEERKKRNSIKPKRKPVKKCKCK